MFKYQHMTMTQIGQLFNGTAQDVGKWLVDIGLRTRAKRPSVEAFQGGYVEQGPSRNGGYNWCWHSEKTVEALEAAGHRRIYNPPLNLVDPPTLNGPFAKEANAHNGFDILSGDGTVAIVVVGARNAECVLDLLNLAHKHGVLARHLGNGPPKPKPLPGEDP